MTRHDFPGERDPSRRDRQARRREADEECLRNTPPQLLRSISQARAQLLASLPDTDANLWVPLGPSAVLRGQAAGKPRVSGRVRDLVVSPDGRRVYVATASGGVWYSGNGGTTWSPLGGWATSPETLDLGRATAILACGCLLVEFGAAADGSGDKVMVGTGETLPARSATPGSWLGGVGVLVLELPLAQALGDPRVNPWRLEAPALYGAGIYRLVHDPANFELAVAATSVGLFARDGSGSWTRVAVSPFDFDADDNKWCTDALWTPAAGTTPARLWVTLITPSSADLYVSSNGIAGPFEQVSLSGAVGGGRLGLAVAPSDPTVIYLLGKGPRLWRIDGLESHRVERLPKHLFGAKQDQSHYDLAIAVHPATPTRIMIGGSLVKGSEGGWEASLFSGTLGGSIDDGLFFPFTDTEANQANPGADSSFVGEGVHADVHQIRYVQTATHTEVWIGCDGGVFRSRQAGAAHTYVALNTGLATLEPGYVASHPTHDGVVLVGTQDNGVLRKIGNTVWELTNIMGDGGGVAFHPTSPSYFLGQYTGADWYSNGGAWVNPVDRNGDGHQDCSVREEDQASSFYSGVATRSNGATTAQVAIGTNRVWITEDWNPHSATTPAMNWQTIPSATDPRAGGCKNTGRDCIQGGQVIALRWADNNRLYVLTQRAVVLFRRAGTRWAPDVISHHTPKQKKYDNDDLAENGIEPHLPPLGFWSDIALHDTARNPRGSLYVATTGHARLQDDQLIDSDRMDTLWWFDGNSTWYRTHLRGEGAQRTKAPAYAVVVDPDDRNIVYVGTGAGVWRGTLTFNDDTPSWTWEALLNGLPEAAVQDLVVFKSGNTKLLRAALQARGVWECDLSPTPMPNGRTYLRVHPVDTRRTAPSAPTPLENPLQRRSDYEWFDTPDIALRPAPGGAPPALPASFPLRTRFPLWAFQTALRSVDPLCRPNGQDSDQFKRRVRAFRARENLAPLGSSDVDQPLWDRVMAVGTPFHTPWDGDEPSEADLAELVADEFTAIHRGRLILPLRARKRAYRVEVLVHHRHTRPLPGADVNVLLFRREIAAAENPDTIALATTWIAAVVAHINGSGTPPLGDGWVVVDPAGIRHPAGPLDARTPRCVTFDFDATPLTDLSLHVLLAVVSSTRDVASVANMTRPNVRDLVLHCHHAAARLVRVEP